MQLAFRIPLDFIEAHAGRLTWRELAFGFDAGFVDEHVVVEALATQRPHRTRKSKGARVVDLKAFARGKEQPRAKLGRLARKEPEQLHELIRDKWLFLVLAWLYDQRHERIDPLEDVERVYAAFDYPETMTGFVPYLPGPGGQDHDVVANWEAFLRARQVEYGTA